MGVVSDITRSWRNPRGLIRDKTADVREDRALATLLGASALLFIAQWPNLARQAHLDPSIPMDARIGGSLMGVVFILPLVMYVLAFVSHLIARALGGQASGYQARVALFQALLGSAPLTLLYGLIRGVQGDSGLAFAVGGLASAGFLWMWLTMLWTVEKGQDVQR